MVELRKYIVYNTTLMDIMDEFDSLNVNGKYIYSRLCVKSFARYGSIIKRYSMIFIIQRITPEQPVFGNMCTFTEFKKQLLYYTCFSPSALEFMKATEIFIKAYEEENCSKQKTYYYKDYYQDSFLLAAKKHPICIRKNTELLIFMK